MGFWNQSSGQKGHGKRASFGGLGGGTGTGSGSGSGNSSLGILRKGRAMRVIFFYPGEEGTYVDHAEVTLYENGIVHIASNQEESTTHLQNCEILWNFEVEADDRAANKVRLLKSRDNEAKMELSQGSSKDEFDGPKPTRPGKGPGKNV